MNKYETPIDFPTEIKVENNEVVYHNIFEIGQGGPIVGNISINKEFIPAKYFGGPVLFYKKHIYIPIYLKGIISWKFKLARINIDTFKIEIIGKLKSVIFLEKIENEIVFFYEDVNKVHLNNYKLSKFEEK